VCLCREVQHECGEPELSQHFTGDLLKSFAGCPADYLIPVGLIKRRMMRPQGVFTGHITESVLAELPGDHGVMLSSRVDGAHLRRYSLFLSIPCAI